MEPLVGHCRADSGEHPDRAQYWAAMVPDRGVVVRITPTRGGPSRAG